MAISPYSPQAAIVTPTARYLRAVTQVQRDFTEAVEGLMVVDAIYREGQSTPTGLVEYDRSIEANNVGLQRAVQQVEELSEFPIVNAGEPEGIVVKATKWGGAFLFSYEKQKADRRDLLAEAETRLRVAVLSAINLAAIAPFVADTAVRTYAAPATWGTATSNPIRDLSSAKVLAQDRNRGYRPETVLIHEDDAVDLISHDVVNKMPRENVNVNPVMSGELQGLLNLQFFVGSNADGLTAGTAYVLSSQRVGSYHDADPLTVDVIDIPERHGTLVQAYRRTVPVITDPESVTRITGI